MVMAKMSPNRNAIRSMLGPRISEAAITPTASASVREHAKEGIERHHSVRLQRHQQGETPSEISKHASP